MKLWTLKNTAEYLNRSEGSVRKLVLRGLIPYRKPGGRLCFIENEIVEWVKAAPGKKIEDVVGEWSR
jgi:excisionase family DNA binding protein